MKRDIYAFGDMTEWITKAIRQLGDNIPLHFAPRNLTHKEVIELSVPVHDRHVLQEAYKLARLRINPLSNGEDFTLKLPSLGQYLLHARIPNDSPWMMLRPDCAFDEHAVLSPDAPPDLVSRLDADVRQWIEASQRWSVVDVVFRKLNYMPDITREQIRYCFPAIVPLLRVAVAVVAERGIKGNIGKLSTLRSYINGLSSTNARHFYGPPLWLRPLVQEANDTVAKAMLLGACRDKTQAEYARVILTSPAQTQHNYFKDEDGDPLHIYDMGLNGS